MRVLIVGCGYVGLPLGAELVRLGHEVHGLRRNSGAEEALKAAGVVPHFGDLTRPEALAGQALATVEHGVVLGRRRHDAVTMTGGPGRECGALQRQVVGLGACFSQSESSQ